ncbi:uncharacterized protein AMSG_08362 [Thecamonas trahens ATCC 50062]|uniref:Uncharacterized protein n=1 Tax=Thecamonas trahens ATCC 50062 TaxID=461836 RepID=A0A0L0DLX2_THETB|nr:hypothetical protein AMSG_08362 [Thecamonas trahens ATCC 50062]KNC52388.1 hypothetical protein AMSG_08362 [Thecamonas trahens ATCC 50062]|eukprot:XP_013755432.1 hypothetical protein AMSG_08362 [Thecamonas trahens ATCC 50062]
MALAWARMARQGAAVMAAVAASSRRGWARAAGGGAARARRTECSRCGLPSPGPVAVAGIAPAVPSLALGGLDTAMELAGVPECRAVHGVGAGSAGAEYNLFCLREWLPALPKLCVELAADGSVANRAGAYTAPELKLVTLSDSRWVMAGEALPKLLADAGAADTAAVPDDALRVAAEVNDGAPAAHGSFTWHE